MACPPAAGSLRPARWKGVVLSIVGVVVCAGLIVAYVLMRTSMR